MSSCLFPPEKSPYNRQADSIPSRPTRFFHSKKRRTPSLPKREYGPLPRLRKIRKRAGTSRLLKCWENDLLQTLAKIYLKAEEMQQFSVEGCFLGDFRELFFWELFWCFLWCGGCFLALVGVDEVVFVLVLVFWCG